MASGKTAQERKMTEYMTLCDRKAGGILKTDKYQFCLK